MNKFKIGQNHWPNILKCFFLSYLFVLTLTWNNSQIPFNDALSSIISLELQVPQDKTWRCGWDGVVFMTTSPGCLMDVRAGPWRRCWSTQDVTADLDLSVRHAGASWMAAPCTFTLLLTCTHQAHACVRKNTSGTKAFLNFPHQVIPPIGSQTWIRSERRVTETNRWTGSD